MTSRSAHICTVLALAGGLSITTAGPAVATADVGPIGAPTVLAAGELRAALALEASLDDGRTNLSPDVWYGLGERLTLGLHHGYRSAGTVGAARGLCLARCDAAQTRHRGVGLSARFPLVAGDTVVAGELQTDVAAWSPAAASVVVGVVARWQAGRAWAQAAPRLALGLLGRADGNRERATIDVAVGAPLARCVGVELGVGSHGAADAAFFAGMAVPLWTQLVVDASGRWRVGLAVGTDDLRAGSDLHGFVAATVEVRVAG
ncbi:MAG: hypothetical protein R3B06_25270 [Kofleriaceae bacterium]